MTTPITCRLVEFEKMATAKPSLTKIPRLDEGEDNEDIKKGGQGERDKQQQLALEKILSIQQEIDKLNEQASEEILHVEQKYNKLRKPHYQRRAELAREIPEFWYITLINHPSIGDLLSGDDESALQYLTHLTVEEFDDVKSGFKISLHFKENPFFSNNVLSKDFYIDENEGNIVTGTSIQWLPGADLTTRQAPTNEEEEETGRKRPHEDPPSFFCWFNDCDTTSGDEIAEIFKDEIWPNPMQYYLQINETSIGEEEEEEDGEEEEEEEEEEEDEDELVDLEEEEVEEEEDEYDEGA